MNMVVVRSLLISFGAVSEISIHVRIITVELLLVLKASQVGLPSEEMHPSYNISFLRPSQLATQRAMPEED